MRAKKNPSNGSAEKTVKAIRRALSLQTSSPYPVVPERSPDASLQAGMLFFQGKRHREHNEGIF